jgi:hypothetical protein
MNGKPVSPSEYLEYFLNPPPKLNQTKEENASSSQVEKSNKDLKLNMIRETIRF